MYKAFSIIRLPLTAVLYLATYLLISYAVWSSLNLLYYFDVESDFQFWRDSYLLQANSLCFLVSLVIIVLWSILHNSKIRNSHRLTEIVFGRFLIFFIFQLLACTAFVITVRGPEGTFLFYPVLYLVTFSISAIFLSTYLVSGVVVPCSGELWFRVVFAIISLGSYALVFLI